MSHLIRRCCQWLEPLEPVGPLNGEPKSSHGLPMVRSDTLRREVDVHGDGTESLGATQCDRIGSGSSWAQDGWSWSRRFQAMPRCRSLAGTFRGRTRATASAKGQGTEFDVDAFLRGSTLPVS